MTLDNLTQMVEAASTRSDDRYESLVQIHDALRAALSTRLTVTRRRLDAELVRRGLARSRQQASELIAAGHVNVNHMLATKASTQVEDTASVIVRPWARSTFPRCAQTRGSPRTLRP